MRTLLVGLHSKFIHPSLALPYLAAFCGPDCGQLPIREFTVHEPRENVLAALLAEAPDTIGFSVYLWNRERVLELVDALHVVAPGINIFLGGPEVSFDGPELLARHPGISALVRGEGEIPVAGLLRAWAANLEPVGVPRLLYRWQDRCVEGPDGPPLAELDAIPSPFAAGLADLTRGFVYYETSRGCPYRCAFCMSALDQQVRSFSMARIFADLELLLARRVPKIKLVDRTFNYDVARARQIFAFILAHNQGSHLHFEIGAQLLDEPTLQLLERVPAGMFQFEIGVQSTLESTLAAIDRRVALEPLLENIRQLRRRTAIELHLDLIAGLPGEGFDDFLRSVDRVVALTPGHLQLEPVKLLPGSPLRQDAERLGLRFDPSPPYTVLATPDLSFDQLERLRALGRLLDLSWNSGRLRLFLAAYSRRHNSFATGALRLADYFRQHQLLRHPLSQRELFEHLWQLLQAEGATNDSELQGALGRDFCHCERVAPGQEPAFVDLALTAAEAARVQARLRQRLAELRGKGTKLQHTAAVFRHPDGGREVRVFFYLARPNAGRTVEEEILD